MPGSAGGGGTGERVREIPGKPLKKLVSKKEMKGNAKVRMGNSALKSRAGAPPKSSANRHDRPPGVKAAPLPNRPVLP